MILKKAKQTCDIFPVQWELTLVDGRMVYVRERNGFLTMKISEKATNNISEAVGQKPFYSGKEDISQIGKLIAVLKKAGVQIPEKTVFELYDPHENKNDFYEHTNDVEPIVLPKSVVVAKRTLFWQQLVENKHLIQSIYLYNDLSASLIFYLVLNEDNLKNRYVFSNFLMKTGETPTIFVHYIDNKIARHLKNCVSPNL